jgi:hypothetical protein
VELSGLLKENPNVTVTVANKVCVKKGLVMKREFLDALQVCLPNLPQASPARVTRLGKFLTFGYFLLGYFLQFYLIKYFQNTVCCTYFNIPKQFDATIFYFQFELL